jgi:DNA (cytosine-5)-methyltransferase 1
MPETKTPHRVVGLFAGIGGIELGFSEAGFKTALLCENNDDANAVLDERFADVPRHGDVTTLDPDTDLGARSTPTPVCRASHTAASRG